MGVALLFSVIGNFLGAFDLPLLTALPQRLIGLMENDLLQAIPMFVYLGVIMQRTTLAAELLEAMSSLFGSRAGGLSISTVILGALLAPTTGAVGASVLTLGLARAAGDARREVPQEPRLRRGLQRGNAGNRAAAVDHSHRARRPDARRQRRGADHARRGRPRRADHSRHLRRHARARGHAAGAVPALRDRRGDLQALVVPAAVPSFVRACP